MVPAPCFAPCYAPAFVNCWGWIGRHAKYVISASRYVEDIKKKKNDLVATKADLDEKIEEGRRRLQKPSNENQVGEWQEQVDAIIPEIDEVVYKYESRACFWAICSNHKTGHRCDYKIKQVDALLIQGSQHLHEEMVACPNPIVPISMPYAVPGSLDSNFTKALNYIKDEEGNVIGIWGPGGVGKTTLLTKIYNSSCVANNAIFNTVIWIAASKDQSNVAMIQQKIVEMLRLAKRDDDVQSQARIIQNFLVDQNFLLFIDDLWDAVELNEVGVPNPYEEGCGKRRKVIFTTRSLEVCGNMEAREPIKVDCLNWEDSWTLFKEKVGDRVLSNNHRISKIAEDVAKECKGLPLALKTIGRAMSQKKTFNEWKSALDFMKKSQVHNVPGIKKDEMQHVLKLSYDYLDDDALKRCFLTVSMWPEDFLISKTDLIGCWMGLDIIDNFENIDEAYQTGHSLIERLVAAALLEDGDDASCVKMHDVIRDLALWIASDCGKNNNKWLVKAGIELQKTSGIKGNIWSEAECISLMYTYIKELPSSSIPSCPHLFTLMLQWNRLTCESILTSFHKFQSLNYLDLSGNQLGSFPESICSLIELRYLNLSHNNINNIPDNLRNLQNLKYLILRGNPIYNVPREVFSELGKLLVLDLFSEASGVNPQVLKCLEKKLLFLGISVRTEEDFNKLLNMSDLGIIALSVSNLHIKSFNFMSMIPNPYCLRELFIGFSNDLLEIIFKRNDIHQHRHSINLEKLDLSYLGKLERIIWKNIQPKNLFAELQTIEICKCNLDDITWVIHLPSLVSLKIYCCDKIRIAINNEDSGNNTNAVEPYISTFPSLRKLSFERIKNLEKISTSLLAFPELNQLKVYGCPLLKTLPVAVESTPKLLGIGGTTDWWDNLEWEDDEISYHFNQLFYVL